MKKVYVAGKLNDNAVGYIKNMHQMITTADTIRRMGYSVYVPCLDFLSGLVHGGYGYADYFQNNLPWMLASDLVFVVPGWETSTGTKNEIEIAKANNIPVYFNIHDLISGE
jgi:hypothetical protein